MAIAATCLLAIVAYLFAVQSTLPIVSYLTLADYSIMAALGGTFLSGVGNFLAYLFEKYIDEEAGENCDWHFRYILPLMFFGPNVILFLSGLRHRRRSLESTVQAQEHVEWM